MGRSIHSDRPGASRTQVRPCVWWIPHPPRVCMCVCARVFVTCAPGLEYKGVFSVLMLVLTQNGCFHICEGDHWMIFVHISCACVFIVCMCVMLLWQMMMWWKFYYYACEHCMLKDKEPCLLQITLARWGGWWVYKVLDRDIRGFMSRLWRPGSDNTVVMPTCDELITIITAAGLYCRVNLMLFHCVLGWHINVYSPPTSHEDSPYC